MRLDDLLLLSQGAGCPPIEAVFRAVQGTSYCHFLLKLLKKHTVGVSNRLVKSTCLGDPVKVTLLVRDRSLISGREGRTGEREGEGVDYKMGKLRV